MTAKTYTLGALVVFALLGALDFVDTYVLIRRSDGKVYESNPLASTWLKDFGWQGLAIFKAASIAVAVIAVAIVRRKKPRTAAVLATAACLTLLAVTLYSRNLLIKQEDRGSGQQNASVRNRV